MYVIVTKKKIGKTFGKEFIEATLVCLKNFITVLIFLKNLTGPAQ